MRYVAVLWYALCVVIAILVGFCAGFAGYLTEKRRKVKLQQDPVFPPQEP